MDEFGHLIYYSNAPHLAGVDGALLMIQMRESPVRKRPVYLGKSVNFHADTVRLPNGKKAIREYMDHPGAVGVIPFLNPATIVLVRQYRYPVGRHTWEIPAGKLHSRGESPLACVRRELREETGYTAGRIRPLVSYWPTPAFSNERLHLFVAEDLRSGRISPDEDEFLDASPIPYRRALEWAVQGKIRDSKTMIALLAYEVLRSGRHYTKFRSGRRRG